MPAKPLLFLIVTLSILAFSACQTGGSSPTLEVGLSPQTIFSPVPTPPAAQTEPQTLTICLGQEPNTLYVYDNPNAAARSVLSAIYDGPVDILSYQPRPVILQQIPTLENGGVVLAKIAVSTGNEIVDANGTPVTLTAGVRLRPSGCRSDDCAIVYDGAGPVEMDQMVVTFTLLPGLYWSDGKPLTSADSIYAYNLAADPKSSASKYLIDRTQSYEASDDLSVQWWGKPGYIDSTFYTNFWPPLPAHQLSQFSAAELPTVDLATRSPLGWGAYKMETWQAGQEIRLSKNLFYFRSAEGLPAFDQLIFRFVDGPEQALSDLMTGKCDMLDASVQLDNVIGLLVELQQAGKLRAYFHQTMTLEQLAFGLRPASYDNGYSLGSVEDRPDFFADVRVRQAVALCLDRQQVVDTVLYGLVDVPHTFVPTNHPLYNPAIPTYAYDPAAAAQLLDQAGWRDTDNNPSTPRVAQGVFNVRVGTPLVLNYYTTGATQRRQVSEILSKSLQACGIGVNLVPMPFEAFYAPGPEGVLFGRQFDLAQFAMGVPGTEPPCGWYASLQVPGEANAWVGTNVSGYSNPAYDAACQIGRQALPTEAVYSQRYQEVQTILAQDLPFVPLYFRLKIAASRPDLCGFDFGNAAEPDLWSLEQIRTGRMCP